MVKAAAQHGIKPAARMFCTTVKTVRKWVRRYEQAAYNGLRDNSRAPKHPHRPISPSEVQRAIDLKRLLPSFGAERIKRDFELTLSVKAIRKVWKEVGLMRVKRRKHHIKNDLRAVKASWRVFEQLDIDVKYLTDIPQYWPHMKRHDLPRYQYTARDVVSGMQFLGFANEISLNYSALFAETVIAHLLKCGVDLANCRVQTDNGSEFIGNWTAKHDSSFTKAVQKMGLAHWTIPPAAHTYQADVETAHRLIEDEFYEVESFSSKHDFLQKTFAYQLWFNVARKNSYKKNKTPWDILHERDATVNPRIVLLPPLMLDDLYRNTFVHDKQRGYDVIPYPFTAVAVTPGLRHISIEKPRALCYSGAVGLGPVLPERTLHHLPLPGRRPIFISIIPFFRSVL
jgi:transposase